MKFQYIKKNTQLFFLLAILILSSCSDNQTESLFDENTAIRTENRINELRELLKSSTDGWRTVYFPDDSKLGGFTFNMRFVDDRNVEMISNLSTSTTPVKSEYSIEFGATVSLVFSSKGLIHDLVSNSTQGDLEFLYYGQDGDDIIFRSNRTNREIKFSKITANEWTNFSQIQGMMTNMTQDPTQSVFRTLTIGSDTYDFSYTVPTRFANSSFNDFGIGFTETGIVVSPALDLGNGVEVTEFEYDATTSRFVATGASGNELASIEYTNAPAAPLTGYEDFRNYTEFQSFRNLSFGQFGLDTPAYTTFLANASAQITAFGGFGVELRNLVFDDLDQTVSSFRVFSVANGTVTYTIEKTIVDNKVVFTRTASDAPAVFDDIYEPILDFIFDPQGFYVEKVTDNSNGTSIFSFVSVADTRVRFGTWAFDF